MGRVVMTATAALLLGACMATPPAAMLREECATTSPNGRVPPDFPPDPESHGNGRIWTILPLDGRLVATGSDVSPDGSVRRKFGWWTRRSAGRRLRVTGRRLDGPSPPLRARVSRSPNARHLPRVFPSTLIFPRQGCWSVTARTGRSALRFVISVTAGRTDRR